MFEKHIANYIFCCYFVKKNVLYFILRNYFILLLEIWIIDFLYINYSYSYVNIKIEIQRYKNSNCRSAYFVFEV